MYPDQNITYKTLLLNQLNKILDRIYEAAAANDWHRIYAVKIQLQGFLTILDLDESTREKVKGIFNELKDMRERIILNKDARPEFLEKLVEALDAASIAFSRAGIRPVTRIVLMYPTPRAELEKFRHIIIEEEGESAVSEEMEEEEEVIK
ncbi:hypothetical protein DRP04_06040 [Archaeoglobales archaeon]|nr:MAG: hypothetical protein DRP04_06040 [Archaeoglobales archaeon]